MLTVYYPASWLSNNMKDSDPSIFAKALTQSRLLTTLKKKPFENIEGNGENAGNQNFFPFPSVFYPSQDKFSFFSHINFILSSANAFNLDQSKNLLFGKKLKVNKQQEHRMWMSTFCSYCLIGLEVHRFWQNSPVLDEELLSTEATIYTQYPCIFLTKARVW